MLVGSGQHPANFSLTDVQTHRNARQNIPSRMAQAATRGIRQKTGSNPGRSTGSLNQVICDFLRPLQ
jgi:hypothetical protein